MFLFHVNSKMSKFNEIILVCNFMYECFSLVYECILNVMGLIFIMTLGENRSFEAFSRFHQGKRYMHIQPPFFVNGSELVIRTLVSSCQICRMTCLYSTGRDLICMWRYYPLRFGDNFVIHAIFLSPMCLACTNIYC